MRTKVGARRERGREFADTSGAGMGGRDAGYEVGRIAIGRLYTTVSEYVGVNYIEASGWIE